MAKILIIGGGGFIGGHLAFTHVQGGEQVDIVGSVRITIGATC